MRHSALLSLTALTALLVPTLEVAATSQKPNLEPETGVLSALKMLSTAGNQPEIEPLGWKTEATQNLAQTDSRQVEANRLSQQGIEQYKARQIHAALQFLEPALAIYREIGDRAGEEQVLWYLGNAYLSLDEYQQAINFYEQSLAITREIGDRSGERTSLGQLGNAYHSLGEYWQAIDFYEQSLAISREIGDRAGEGFDLWHLGLSYDDLSEYQQAIDLYEQSLAITREVGDHTWKSALLERLGLVYRHLGEYQQAIDRLEQQLAIAREFSDRGGEGRALGNLGLTYRLLGDYQKAIDLLEHSLAITREVGDRRGEGSALGSLGFVYNNLGDYQKAIDLLWQSLTITREISDRAGEGNALNVLGSTYSGLGDYQQAINFYEQSLAITREIGDLMGEENALGNLGSVYASLGQYQQAIAIYGQSLAITREIGDRAGEAIDLGNLGVVYARLGQYAEAATLLFRSVGTFESLRTNLPDAQLISIADTQAYAYANLEWALISQEKIVEALTITERGRGRAFVLQLASRFATEEERAALEASPVAQVPTVAEIQQIARDTNTTLVTYSLIFDQALYIWVVKPSGDIEFRSVEFEGGGDGSPVVNPIASIDGPVYRSATPDSALTALVNDSRSAVNKSSNPNTPQLQELHEVLIDPIADLLPSNPNAQVAFIPQGQLFLVPFAALQDEDGTYLIEKHTILTAPSIQIFGLANEAGQGTGNRAQETGVNSRNALVVGNPTMPTVWLPDEAGDLAETQLSYLSGAKAEAEAIGEFFNIPVLTGEQATEARIKQELPNASLIHLATHGLLEYGIPESSGVLDLPGAVALAPGNGEDGLLTSAEILEMDLQANLAILSACDTGRGRITGDGVVGLSRALITAGVPSVMVSLWAVNDDSTSILMQRFYEFLVTGELTKAEALRQAQLSLLYDEDVSTRLDAIRTGAAPQYREGLEPLGDRHPYHWAPFVLIGNGQ